MIMSEKPIVNELKGRIKELEQKITKFTLLEENYQQNKTELNALFNKAPLIMFIVDRNHCVSRLNEAAIAMTRRLEKESIGLRGGEILRCVNSSDDPKGCGFSAACRSCIVRNTVSDTFQTGQAHQSVKAVIPYGAVNGTKKLQVLVSTTLLTQPPKEKKVLVCLEDITEHVQTEKAKIKAQKIAGEHEKLALVGQVAGKMAHDFNNILGVIMGNTELLLLDCMDTKIRQTLKLIFKQTMRGKNLTKNLVVFAKDQEPRQEFFQINQKIDLVLNLLKKDLEGIELIQDEKPGIPELLADPGMIEHALVNLVQNSIHALSMVEHPQLIIRIYHTKDNLWFEIEDNGCGIPKEYLERIYEPSFTLKGIRDETGSYKTGIKGTGYGMANVKKYIEQHKGSIFVESNITKGTKISISLPVIKKGLTREEKTEIQKEYIYSDRSILLVEDEPAISAVQYKILTKNPCNHRVDIANNGQVAMDLLKKNRYELVSLDHVLPGKAQGMDIYHNIRETDKDIPVLFISGNIEFLESIKELKQKDANIDHLSKPCRNKDYINSINDLFEKTLSTSKE